MTGRRQKEYLKTKNNLKTIVMCGIAGVVGGKDHKLTLMKMLEVQNHRGPDCTGI